MAKIKQLPPLEAQKIAAGEVIERPANIVKELIENSLDAGSTVITIYIEDAGKKLTINQGNIVSQESCSTPIGTDISIADLFFNIPVRKKFLRSNTTELNQIVYLFQALCLAHQNVHFKLYSQTKLIHNCPATEDLSSRLFQVWDQLISSRMITL